MITLGYRDARSRSPMCVKPSREPLGYSIDLCLGVVDEIARELQGADVAVAYAPVTSDNRIEAVAVAARSISNAVRRPTTLERARAVAFSPIIFVAGTKLMAKRGSGIRCLRDLERQDAGRHRGHHQRSGDARAQRRVQARHRHRRRAAIYDSSTTCLPSGKADAFATDDVLLAA